MITEWPSAELDPVRRLRALAAGIGGAHITECVVDTPAERVWALLADLDGGGFAQIQPDMRTVRVTARVGDRVQVRARSRFGPRAQFEGVLRPGWCWLQSRYLIIGMAVSAEPDGRTRVALTGGVRIPRRAALLPLRVRAESRRSLDRLERILSAPADGPPYPPSCQ